MVVYLYSACKRLIVSRLYKVPTKQNYVVVLELREMKKLFLRQEIISTREQRYRDVSYIDDRVEKTRGRAKLILTKLSFENIVFCAVSR